MLRRAAFGEGLCDRLVRCRSKRTREIRQEIRNMIDERRSVKPSRSGEFLDLRTPPREYIIAILFDQPCKFTKNVDDLSSSLPPLVVSPCADRPFTCRASRAGTTTGDISWPRW